METKDIMVILGIIAGIVTVGSFLALVIYPLLYPPVPPPTPTPAPTPSTTPILTPTSILTTPTPTPYTPPPTNNPPAAFIDSINPSPALQGKSISFTGHGEDPDSGDYITEYRWESSIDGFLSDQKTFSTSRLTSGLHKIILRVKDSHGQWSSEITRNLKVKIYLREDFESGMPENWWLGISPVVSPEAKESPFYDVIVEPGTSNHVLRGYGHVHTGPNISQEWEDYSLQVRIMLLKGGCNLNIRHFWESEENNWRYFIAIQSDKVEIWKTVNSENNCITRGDKYLGYNTWHTVKIICREDQIKVLVDGEFVTEYIDADPLKNGRINLETWKPDSEEEVYYDDILAEEVD
jgi:hypothetical protein